MLNFSFLQFVKDWRFLKNSAARYVQYERQTIVNYSIKLAQDICLGLILPFHHIQVNLWQLIFWGWNIATFIYISFHIWPPAMTFQLHWFCPCKTHLGTTICTGPAMQYQQIFSDFRFSDSCHHRNRERILNVMKLSNILYIKYFKKLLSSPKCWTNQNPFRVQEYQVNLFLGILLLHLLNFIGNFYGSENLTMVLDTQSSH